MAGIVDEYVYRAVGLDGGVDEVYKVGIDCDIACYADGLAS